MRFSRISILFLVLGILPTAVYGALLHAQTEPADAVPAPNPATVKKFEQAVDSTENLMLPINKVVLYREAATALIPTDRPQGIMLLKRALSDIDAAEAAMKAQHTLDEKTYQLLEFHRLPVIMVMEQIDPAEALNTLLPPQTADHDIAFYTFFFQKLKNPELVRQAAMHKMDYGVTPAAVAAYGVLKESSPGEARTLGTAIVLKLTKADPANDAEAVHAAFRLTHLLRTDRGALAPKMIIDPDLLSPNSVQDLFKFLGDAFLASKDPKELISSENPALYMSALDVYAPAKALDVRLLPFAAPSVNSQPATPEPPVYDANHPDPKTLTPEQIERRAAMKAQVMAQIDDSNRQIGVLEARANQETLPRKDRDAAVFQAVEQANKAISLARAQATSLDWESFRDGELEFYHRGPVSDVVENVSRLLQIYALKHPQVAENAARNLDGHDVQTQVALGVAIREMTGSPPYVYPAAKPSARVPLQVPLLPGAPAGLPAGFAPQTLAAPAGSPQQAPATHPTVP